MGISLQNQAVIFLFAVCAGALISLIFDVFRVLRIALPHGVIATALEDLLFSLCTLAVILMFLMTFNNGVFRMYIAVGMALGFTLCHYTLGALIVLQARLIVKILTVVIRIILTPFRFILRLICKFFRKTGLFFKKPFIFLKKRCIILLNGIFSRLRKAGGITKRGKNKKNKPDNQNSSRFSNSVPSLRVYRSSDKNKRKKAADKRIRRKNRRNHFGKRTSGRYS
ncbi:MAG: spore cortex biosynthesis protein YabQ [Clostridia bacterium]|nr:spore cortex biosynthesis protein YabQ [Clostridia bacterium]